MFIGFGKTGKQALSLIRHQNWMFKPQGDSEKPYPLLLISTDASDGNSEMSSIAVELAENRMGIFSRNFENIRNSMNQYLGTLGNHKTNRCFVFASLSEQEVGLFQPVLECLANYYSGLRLPEFFLSIQSPDGSMPYQDRYATTREIRHLLHESGHAGSQRLLERVYLFDGSGDRDEYLNSTIAGMAGGALLLANGGNRLAAHENSVINPDDGPVAVRTLGLRIAFDPPMELVNYFIWRYLHESWERGKTLIPISRPSQSDINDIFNKGRAELRECLNSWVGESFTSWLFQSNAGSLPEIDPQIARLRLLNGVISLHKANQSALLWASLSLIEAKTLYLYPTIHDVVTKSMEGLDNLSKDTAEIQSFFEEKIKEAKNGFVARTQASIMCWITSHAVTEEADRRYEAVRDELKKTIERANQENILEYQEVGNKIQWNLIQPASIIDIRGNFKSYFKSTFNRMRDIMPVSNTMMGFSRTAWNPQVNTFMQGANQRLVTHPDGGTRRHALLFSPEVKNFSFQPSPQFLPPLNSHILANMTVFTGLQLDLAGNIPDYRKIYNSQESIHINDHVKNAAYFESNLPRKYLNGRFFCDKLISYLYDRNPTLSFFEAYFAGLLDWDKKGRTWRIKPLNDDYADEIILSSEHFNDLDKREEKNLQSLWKAYCRFVVDIPSFLDREGGAWHHFLFRIKRPKYLEKMMEISYQKELKPDRLEWLAKEVGSIPKNDVLYDFYCLAQAVWGIASTRKFKHGNAL